jgi:hypothetical protein
MSAGTVKRRISEAAILGCLAAALGAGYALDASSALRDRDGQSGSEGPGVFITLNERAAFLACVRRRQMQSDPQLSHVSEGDILPDSGVRYYEIPLRYGAPFYRCVVIGEEVLIVDPGTSRVVQVVD